MAEVDNAIDQKKDYGLTIIDRDFEIWGFEKLIFLSNLSEMQFLDSSDSEQLKCSNSKRTP